MAQERTNVPWYAMPAAHIITQQEWPMVAPAPAQHARTAWLPCCGLGAAMEQLPAHAAGSMPPCAMWQVL